MKVRTVALASLGFIHISSSFGQETYWEDRRKDAAGTRGSELEIDLATVPTVGVKNRRPPCTATREDEENAIGCSVSNKIFNALEMDQMVTVTDIEMGEMVCDTLEESEDAQYLKFAISSKEEVLAKRKSFRIEPRSLFENNMARKVWSGEVIEDEDYEGLPRSVSMTWSGCDPETYLLKLITPTGSGSISSTISVPCEQSADKPDLCIIEVMRQDINESDEDALEIELSTSEDSSDATGGPSQRRLRGVLHSGGTKTPFSEGNDEIRRRLDEVVEAGIAAARAEDPELDAKDRDIELLSDYLGASLEDQEAFHAKGIRRLSPDKVEMPSGRVLSSSNVVDVLVVYTRKARYESGDLTGVIRSKAQMESDIITAYASANDALEDSGVDVTVRVVHMAQVGDIDNDKINLAIYDMYKGTGNSNGIPELREKYGADLVQLFGFFPDSCGIGFTMTSPTLAFARYGYSIVHANCIPNFSHIHEIGHNMGANHDRDNSGSTHQYAYAQRYCTGTQPYRTIMAYESGCTKAPRVNVFSNPDITFAGRPQGTSATNNARALRASMVMVSNFRDTVVATAPYDSTPSPSASNKSTTPSPTPPVTQPTSSNGSSGGANGSKDSIYPGRIPELQMKRIGCWADDPSDRIMEAGTEMPAIPGETIGMKRHNCMAYCFKKHKDYKYFGVEYGRECFCWGDDTRYERLGALEDERCDMPCEGNEEDTCGGANALEVFRMKKNSPERVEHLPEAVYKGCFRDLLSDLAMSNLPVVDYEYATPSACRRHCDAAGFAFFSLQYGYLCSCGDAAPSEDTRAEDVMCRVPCSSPTGEFYCGGNWHKAVFAVEDEMSAALDSQSEKRKDSKLEEDTERKKTDEAAPRRKKNSREGNDDSWRGGD